MESSRNRVWAGAAVAVAMSLLFGLSANPGLWHAALVNPDSAMRLVRLLDILDAHAPLHAVARDGGGTVLHWSHALDSLLLLLAGPAAWLVGWRPALGGVAMLVGPLSMAALGAAITWAAAPFTARPWRWLGAVLAGLAAPIVGYGLPGVVHHHVLLMVTATMAAGWAARIVRGNGGGAALGAWAGAGVWLSPESLPLTLLAICFVWLAWLLQPQPRLARALATASLAFLGVVIAAWLVDPPAAGIWAVEQDRVSVVFVSLGLGFALCSLAAASGAGRLAVGALGLALGVAWVAAFPVLLRGSYGLMPPDTAHVFLDGISEMQPIGSLGEAAADVGLALAGALWLAALAWARRSVLLAYAAACLLLLVAGGVQHVRFAAYPAVFGAALVPVGLGALGGSRVRTWLLAGALLLPWAGRLVTPGHAVSSAQSGCMLDGAVALLAPYPGQTVLADVNDTPDLLWRTQVLTVGSLYHRNAAAFLRLRAAWRSPPGDAEPAAVAATGAGLVLVCPGAKRPGLLADAPGPTLLATLQAGVVPAWLDPVGEAGGYHLYAVRR